MFIEPKRWGRDHWSLLGYIVTCFDGVIDRRRLRCNENRHLLRAHPSPTWKDEWSTRLKEGIVTGHDDWDCLDDLEAAGMVNILSLVNGFVQLTGYGNEVAFGLRQHKEKGGNFSDFVLGQQKRCSRCNGNKVIIALDGKNNDVSTIPCPDCQAEPPAPTETTATAIPCPDCQYWLCDSDQRSLGQK